MRATLDALHVYRPFQAFEPRAEHYPLASSAPASPSVRIRWLGTAGHLIETPGATILIDPFLTRPGLLRTALAPLVPDPESWRHYLPAHIDAVLLGHAHYDHLLDAPEIARRTGAQLVGSRSAASFARASGVDPSRIVTVPPSGLSLDVGDAHVRFVPSLHGRLFAGRVPFPGEVAGSLTLPARLWHYRMGGAFGLHIRAAGVSIYHNGSADLVDAELEGVRADVLLVGLAGRRGTRDYVARLVGLLSPSLVIPTHHDAFFAPLEHGVRLLPGIDLPGFASELARLAPGARLITPTYDDATFIPANGDARDAVLARVR